MLLDHNGYNIRFVSSPFDTCKMRVTWSSLYRCHREITKILRQMSCAPYLRLPFEVMYKMLLGVAAFVSASSGNHLSTISHVPRSNSWFFMFWSRINHYDCTIRLFGAIFRFWVLLPEIPQLGTCLSSRSEPKWPSDFLLLVHQVSPFG